MTTNKNSKKNSRALLEVAVIGMAGRFPGSQNIHEFWENLKNGVESITFFSNEEAEEAGASLELIENPNYVKAFGILEKAGYFDPSFFGYTPKEAEIMNPQMRVFHECAWEALEDAGYNPGSYDGLIGVYAGASSSFYWEAITLLSGKKNEIGNFAADQLTGIDLLTTRISYKLALRGPSSFIQTACSTSLVAIHWACRSLLSGECHIALAGGVKLDANQKQGYLYEEGMIQSPDGHCRSFDAAAKGIIIGNGIGIVVLKRLKNAIADRDHIYAVVKGSAINNDGNRKVGFTAPSVKGEAEVIRTAQAMAHVEPESVGYIETHGTGTPLGDPVEIEALTLAFNTDKRNYCPIGSIKSNIGHLGAAAGVAGFIKTILALKHRLIPPSLHCEIPNPGIDFKSSPFFVNNYLTEWEDNGYPRRAGVSSFGIGGTNAHVLLEEWPETSQSPGQCVGDPVSNGEPMAHPYRLILLSAKTGTALERMTKNLVDYFKKNPGINLAKAAYTLQVGRKGFEYRKMVVCSNRNEVIEKLSNPDSRRVLTFLSKGEERSIIFMFPGQGAQYVNMGLELYQKEKVFRDTVDYCFEILRPLMDYDIKQILYPNDSVSKGSGVSEMSEVSAENTYTSSNPYMSKYPHVSHINQTEIAQPLLFVFEYALARLLMNWGIQPNAMIGYSFGEYVAACTAGVFSVEDALKLVVARSKLIMELPVGFMVSVPLPVDETKPFINDQLSISIDNGLSCIVSGPPAEIEAFEKRMKEKRYMCIRLEHVSHAIHSKMMEPILEKFENIVRDIPLEKPRIPYISNVTGGWAKAEEVTVPRYWAKHMRETVQFAGGVSKLLEAEAIFLEIGPGKVLSTFVRQHNEHNNKKQESMVLNLVRSPGELWSDAEYILNRIGQLWLYGKSSDWDKFYQEKERHRISLPTYSFDDRQLLTETEIFKVAKKGLLRTSLYDKNPNIDEWFYIPVWEQSPLAVHYPSGKKNVS